MSNRDRGGQCLTAVMALKGLLATHLVGATGAVHITLVRCVHIGRCETWLCLLGTTLWSPTIGRACLNINALVQAGQLCSPLSVFICLISLLYLHSSLYIYPLIFISALGGSLYGRVFGASVWLSAEIRHLYWNHKALDLLHLQLYFQVSVRNGAFLSCN